MVLTILPEPATDPTLSLCLALKSQRHNVLCLQKRHVRKSLPCACRVTELAGYSA